MRKYFPQGVLWCKKPEREHGARQPLPLTAAVFFACAAMPRNRAKRDAKNSRSAERGCSSVLTPPIRRRTVGASNPAPPRAGYAVQSRKARCKKQPERRARLFLCPPAAEQAANGWGPQPCPTTSRLCRAIAQSAMHKQLSSPKRSPPPHTPLKHPAMSLLCIHIPQNSCTIFVILLCRG